MGNEKETTYSVLELIKKLMSEENRKIKRGKCSYRLLSVTENEESLEAIKILEESGLAYTIIYHPPGCEPEEEKLPSLQAGIGPTVYGLDQIRAYKHWRFLFLGEMVEETEKEKENKAFTAWIRSELGDKVKVGPVLFGHWFLVGPDEYGIIEVSDKNIFYAVLEKAREWKIKS